MFRRARVVDLIRRLIAALKQQKKLRMDQKTADMLDQVHKIGGSLPSTMVGPHPSLMDDFVETKSHTRLEPIYSRRPVTWRSAVADELVSESLRLLRRHMPSSA